MRKYTYLVLFAMLKAFIINAQSPGSIEGTFDVSDMGAGTYAIPLQIPTGIANVEPTLSLNYNSQGSNGILGVGWNISGISAITRLPQNIYHDKDVEGVSLSSGDKFALNGNRLILLNGGYGQAGSIYHTEIESYQQIVANGSLGSAPESFTVTDQEGLTYYYGTSQFTRVTGVGIAEPIMWLLEKVIDKHGNSINYSYFASPGEEPRISAISYTANEVIGAPASSLISFYYDARPDPNFIYVGGAKLTQNYRLRVIYILQRGGGGGDWDIIGSYHMTYTDDFYSHLTRITRKGHELNGVTPEELSPTKFDYGGSVTSPSVNSASAAGTGSGADDVVTGDFNGDGFSDFIRMPKYYGSVNTWDLFTNNGNGGYNLTQSGTLNAPDPNVLQKMYFGISTFKKNSITSFFDFNADGKDDYFYRDVEYWNPAGSVILRRDEYKVFTSNGTNLNLISPKKIVPNVNGVPTTEKFDPTYPLVGDFDGDGKTEVLVLRGSLDYTYSWSYNYLIGEEYLTEFGNYLLPKQLPNMPFDGAYVPSQGNGGNKLFVIDCDGDGKSEVLSIWSTPSVTPVAQVFKLNVTFDANNKPVIGDPAFVLVADGTYPSLYHDIFPGDFNGDGVTDFLTYKSGEGWRIGYGDGKGYVTNIQPAPAGMNMPNVGVNVTRPIVISDFNGDGKSDIYDYTPDNGSYNWGTPYAPRVHYSKGNNVFETTPYSINSSYLAYLEDDCKVGDYNGDGNADLFYKANNVTNMNNVSFRTNEKRHLLSVITNGLGEETRISYAPITDATVYVPGGNVYTYPFIKRIVPMKVVSSVSLDNGVDRKGNNVLYNYVGLKMNAHGKGALGFDQVTSYNQVTLTRTRKQFGVNTQFASSFPVNTVVQIAGQNTSHVIYQYGFHSFGNRRVLPYTEYETTYDYLTGIQQDKIYNYGPLSAGTTDGFTIGRPVQIETNIGTGTDVTIESFEYAPLAFLAPLHMQAKPGAITVTRTRAGQSPYIRKTQYGYDMATGDVIETRTDAGTTNQVITSLSYNTYGNITQKTMTAAGQNPRTEQYQYDLSNRLVTKSFNTAFPGIFSIKEYHPATSTLMAEISPDGYIQNHTYDGFGRLKSTTDNNGASVNVFYIWAFADPFGTGSAYVLKKETNTTLPVFQYFDRKNRTTRTRKTSFNGYYQFTENIYSDKGLLQKASKPYFSGTPVQWMQYSYDDFGRKVTESLPEEDIQYDYSLNSTGLLSSVTHTGSGQQKQTQFDRTGKIHHVSDAVGDLSYKYHSNGEMQTVTFSGSSGAVADTKYDEFGRLVKNTDPNFGSYEYGYNQYNDIVWQKAPSGTTYDMKYNEMGLVTQKNGPEGQYDYTYNTTGGANCGKLIEVDGPQGKLYYDYGIGDKVNSVTQTYNSSSQTFVTEFGYDSYGRKNRHIYPNGTAVSYRYNTNNGALASIIRGNNPNAANAQVLYEAFTRNALDQTTYAAQNFAYYSFNPGVPSFYTGSIKNYDQYDDFGSIEEQRSIEATSSNLIRQYAYNFDPATKNLNWRKDLKYGLAEDFSYDMMNRLTNWGGESNAYENNGNIGQKSDAGVFTYDQANRLSEIEPYTNISIVKQGLKYTPFNMVETISEEPWSAKFTYWPNGERSKMEIYNNGNLDKTITYAPGYEEELSGGSSTPKQLSYVTGPDGNIVSIIVTENGSEKLYSILTDHVGSLTHFVNENGDLTEEKAYDAWGRLRDAQSWAVYPANRDLGQPECKFRRGYTGHEHLAQFGIINMDARLYDPVMGRMFSPDPFVIGAENSQGYNAYSYALNNPLTYNDRSGENPLVIAMVAGAAISALSYTASVAFSDGGFSNWNWFRFTYATVTGGISGALGYGIGEAFGAPTASLAHELGRAGAHGLVGYITTGVGGGNPNSGFVAGFLSSGIGSLTAGTPVFNTAVGGTLLAAGVGGVSAEITGGNFWQGAAIGSIGHVANKVMHALSFEGAISKIIEKLARGGSISGSELKKLLIGLPADVDVSKLNLAIDEIRKSGDAYILDLTWGASLASPLKDESKFYIKRVTIGNKEFWNVSSPQNKLWFAKPPRAFDLYIRGNTIYTTPKLDKVWNFK